MQKTLLDEFAMAALTGLLAAEEPINELSIYARDAYEIAYAMMAERAKRQTQYESDRKLTEQQEKMAINNFAPFSMCSQLRDSIDKFKGKKVTCPDLFQDAYGQIQPSMEQLREIGAILRHRGFSKVRSGGKDYYQL